MNQFYGLVLILENQNYIPKQADGYNCGIATVATTGIILRDFLQKEGTESESLFNDMFVQSLSPTETRKIEREVGDIVKFDNDVFCKVPVALFTELPKTWFECISALREERFMCSIE